MNAPKRTVTLLISAVLLCAGYVLTRYMLFDLHGMKQWPSILLILGIILICIFFRSRLIPLAASAGYSVSFLIGALLEKDSIGAGGTSINNLWIIWTSAYLFLIVAGIATDIIIQKKHGR